MPNIGSLELLFICAIVIVLIFIGAMISGVALKRQTRGTQLSGTPLEILKARYARGEITQAQFEQMKRNLL
jgi:uncharacterized membrane protein